MGLILNFQSWIGRRAEGRKKAIWHVWISAFSYKWILKSHTKINVKNHHSAVTECSEVEQTQLQTSNIRPAPTMTTSNTPGRFLTDLWIYGFTEITDDSNYSQHGYTDNIFAFLALFLEAVIKISYCRCLTTGLCIMPLKYKEQLKTCLFMPQLKCSSPSKGFPSCS